MSLLNSVEWAPSRPSTLRANSMTAHCIPRQMPKNGIPRSRAKRIASTLPSMPRSPNPPGTSMPSKPASSRSGPSRSIDSLWMLLDANLRLIGDAGVVERFVDRLVGVAMLGVFADHGDRDFVLRIAQPVQQIAPIVQIERPGRADPAVARSARRAGCRPGSAALRRSKNPCRFSSITASIGTLQNRAIFSRSSRLNGRSVRQISTSGWMPICRSRPTECCVGLVFSSPAALRYGTSVRWM